MGFEGSVKIWNELKDKGCMPTVVSYTAYMMVFDNNRLKEVTKIYKEMLYSGILLIASQHLFCSGKYKPAVDILSKC